MQAIRIIKNQKGVTLVEIVAATAILAVLVYAIISLKSMVFKMSQSVIQRSSVARVIYSIQEDLVKDLDSLPLRANVSFLTSATINQAAYEASFDDAESQQACYDKEGRPLATLGAPACEFQVAFYRVLEVDRTYSSTEYVPLSRLVMRVKFTDKSTKTPRTLYLTRLKAHALQY